MTPEQCHRAVKHAHLQAQPCERCQAGNNVVAHHDDYGKPLAVRWLCKRCHAKVHDGGRWWRQ